MPKKALSTMTAQDFIECKGALGLNSKQLASALGLKSPTISGYENGNPIPSVVAERIKALITAERERIKARNGKLIDLSAGVGSMIVYQNEQRRSRPDEPHRTEGRFMRRHNNQPERTKTYPVYRMTRERYATYTKALAAWADHVRALALKHGDAARQRDYQLELADIKALAACAPRSVPYDVCISRIEWDVVSRALRHLAATASGTQEGRDASALRCHWARHKGAGFPPNYQRYANAGEHTTEQNGKLIDMPLKRVADPDAAADSMIDDILNMKE